MQPFCIDTILGAVVLALFAAWPNAVQYRNNLGRFPLCSALLAGGECTSDAVFKALFAAWPNAARAARPGENNALHVALAANAPDAALLALIAGCKAAARVAGCGGYTPLHVALLRTDVRDAVAMALIAAWPDSIQQLASVDKARKHDQLGPGIASSAATRATPLHIALRDRVRANVVLAMIEACPDAAQTPCGDGYTTLNYALRYSSDVPQDWYATVVPALVRAWPSVVRATTVSARTPLNYALETRAPKAAVLALIAAAPEAAKQADRHKSWHGYCPLHVALKKKANEVVVLACETARVPTCRILVEGAGGAGGTPERPRQCPPIQSNPFTMFSHGMLICFRPNPFLTSVISTLQALMTVHPVAVTAGIPGVGGTALHVAVTNNASDAVVRGLIGLYRGAIMQTTTIVLGQPPRRHQANAAAVEPAIRGGGDTILHLLATAVCTTTVGVRNTNTLCFTLVEKGASVTATNALGRTPAEAATDDPKFYWRLNNQHLVANFREIRMYNTLFSKANLDADVLRTDAPDLAKLLRAERPVARRLVVVYQPVVTVKLCCRYAVVVRIYNLKKEAFEKR